MAEIEIKIKFANTVAAKHFALWLCEQGEQAYWDWMRCREDEEDGDITALSFDYHGTRVIDGEKVYCEFMESWTINTMVGRLDDDE